MITASRFLRYWYLWMMAAVLGIAAATNLDHGVEIQAFGLSISLRTWQLLAGSAIFLVCVGLLYVWFDQRSPAVPRWVKGIHLVCTVVFFIFYFVFLQIMVSRSLADPHTYFGVGRPHYYEDGNMLVNGVAIAFVAGQCLLLGYLLWRFFRRR